MSTQTVCPVCNQYRFATGISPSEINRESNLRDSFVTQRLGHRPAGLESMDLTRFMHGGQASLLSCRHCGTLLRDEEGIAQYADDLYDSVLMSHLYPRYVHAFQEKKSQYRPMLRDGAEVIEIGSHLGAFLQTAEEWGWRPTGLDIGESTSAFARRQGASVKRLTVDDYAPKLRRPEGIFIWNCFEQLEDPAYTLRRAHQLLASHGLLVVRVPNAGFYRERHRELGSSKSALKLLGYNNLLGFPYLYGYTAFALDRLLRANQFEPVGVQNSSLLTPPYPDMSPRIREEWHEARQQGETSAGVNGPWIEVVSRRVARGIG